MSAHGTHVRYSNGCRCDDCRVAHRAYERERRKVALAEGRLTHGKRSTYDAGCRCDACRATRLIAYYTREATDRRHRRTGVVQ